LGLRRSEFEAGKPASPTLRPGPIAWRFLCCVPRENKCIGRRDNRVAPPVTTINLSTNLPLIPSWPKIACSRPWPVPWRCICLCLSNKRREAHVGGWWVLVRQRRQITGPEPLGLFEHPTAEGHVSGTRFAGRGAGPKALHSIALRMADWTVPPLVGRANSRSIEHSLAFIQHHNVL